MPNSKSPPEWRKESILKVQDWGKGIEPFPGLRPPVSRDAPTFHRADGTEVTGQMSVTTDENGAKHYTLVADPLDQRMFGEGQEWEGVRWIVGTFFKRLWALSVWNVRRFFGLRRR